MISQTDITAWRSIAPWASPDQVEHDLVVRACKQNALCLRYYANEPELKCKYLWISLNKKYTKFVFETELFCK